MNPFNPFFLPPSRSYAHGNKTRNSPPGAYTNSFESGCNFEQPGTPGRERGGGISQRVRVWWGGGRVRISGQISVPVVYEFLRSEGKGSVGRKMRNTKKGVNVGRNESARRRMNRGGLINEIGVEDWRVIDECGGISLKNVCTFLSSLFFLVG